MEQYKWGRLGLISLTYYLLGGPCKQWSTRNNKRLSPSVDVNQQSTLKCQRPSWLDACMHWLNCQVQVSADVPKTENWFLWGLWCMKMCHAHISTKIALIAFHSRTSNLKTVAISRSTAWLHLNNEHGNMLTLAFTGSLKPHYVYNHGASKVSTLTGFRFKT